MAAGRERVNQGAPVGDTGKWDASACGAIPAARNAVWEYTEGYGYDKAGNLLLVDHDVPSDGTKSWEREDSYETDSNRLDETTVGSRTDAWPHDDRGNMLRMPHLRSGVDNLVPDFRDRIGEALLVATTDEAIYLYDGAGERVRKVVCQGQMTQDRRYVRGFEIGRRYESTVLDEVRETLHVLDGKTRVVLVETLTFEEGDPVSSPTPRLRFQLGNHLGSVALEVDEEGLIISYEEYHPYGSTAWWAGDSETVSQKRYRYTGMERDEETGLQCHGVRYYAPWLGRWMSADPIGLGDGVNRYAYCHGNPMRGRDSNGMDDAPADEAIPEGWTLLSNEDAASVRSMIHPSPGGPVISSGVAMRLGEVRDHQVKNVVTNTEALTSESQKNYVDQTDWSKEVEAGRLFVELGDGRVIASKVLQGEVTFSQADPGSRTGSALSAPDSSIYVSNASVDFSSLAPKAVQEFLKKTGVIGVLEVHSHPLGATSDRDNSLPSVQDIGAMVASVDPDTTFSWKHQGDLGAVVLVNTPFKTEMTLTTLPGKRPGVKLPEGMEPGRQRPELAGWLRDNVPGSHLYGGRLTTASAKALPSLTEVRPVR